MNTTSQVIEATELVSVNEVIVRDLADIEVVLVGGGDVITSGY